MEIFERAFEAQKDNLRREMLTYITDKVREGISLEDLVTLLGYNPDDFIETQAVRSRSAGSVRTLSVTKLTDACVEHALESGGKLSLPDSIRSVGYVILPTDDGHIRAAESGDGKDFSKEVIP